MSKKIVALKPRPKKALTLADLTLTRPGTPKPTRITGAELAQLLAATEGRLYTPEGPTMREELTDACACALELRALNHVAATFAEAADGEPFQRALSYLADRLERLSLQVAALAHNRDEQADNYTVEIGR